MKGLVFQVVVFGGMTIWAALSNPWVVPGFACLAASRAVMLAVESDRVSSASVGSALLTQLGLAYVGISYLFAAVVGLPNTWRFWVVFGAVALILFPTLALGRRFFLR